jgi:Staphylococcal nuclease homologue
LRMEANENARLPTKIWRQFGNGFRRLPLLATTSADDLGNRCQVIHFLEAKGAHWGKRSQKPLMKQTDSRAWVPGVEGLQNHWSNLRTKRYGRTLASVRLEGNDINLEQLKSGMAWVLPEARADIQQVYQQAENQAREQHRGLWVDNDPVPPWEYRKAERQLAKQRSQLTRADDNCSPIASSAN